MARRIRLKNLKNLPRRSENDNDDLVKLQQEKLVHIQQALLFTGERAVVVFEGMDAAGKGGTIRRLAWAMDPRSLKVWPIGAPNEIEKKQHYMQRFWERLPEKTQISVFDRSWYGRVLVERVEKFTPRQDWMRAYGEINDFERQMVDDGIRVVKIFLHISKEAQRHELVERLRDPLKRWKLTFDDFRNRSRWSEYLKAIEDMFDRTSTKIAPWHVVPSDDKPAARVEALSIIARELSKGLDLSLPPLDRKVARAALKMLGKNALQSEHYAAKLKS